MVEAVLMPFKSNFNLPLIKIYRGKIAYNQSWIKINLE